VNTRASQCDLPSGRPLFRWRPSGDGPEQVVSPSLAWFSILGAVLPGRYTNETGSPVYNHYSLEPGGPTLEEVATDAGVW
jgi:hypothetical protein